MAGAVDFASACRGEQHGRQRVIRLSRGRCDDTVQILPAILLRGHQMSAIRYEPAIDGLRAIAIGAVPLFHLAPNWLPGGFCGVDVFFVISGYLITSIQLAELEAGTFQLSRFYQRRIARIFPALLAASIFTLLGAVVLYDAQDRAAAGAMFTAVLLSVANMKVMLQGNYFHISQDTQPFMHFWSLSLEEQFYAIFPAVLLLWFRLGRKITACAMCALIAASFIACVALTHVRPTWAFFSCRPVGGNYSVAACSPIN